MITSNNYYSISNVFMNISVPTTKVLYNQKICCKIILRHISWFLICQEIIQGKSCHTKISHLTIQDENHNIYKHV